MDKKQVVPYRTKSGLEIGKFYVEPEFKEREPFDNQLLQEALLETKKDETRGYRGLHYYLAFVLVMVLIEIYFVLTR